MPSSTFPLRSLTLGCCLIALAGCASAVREAAKVTVPVVVSTGLGELGTPQSQAQLKSIARLTGRAGGPGTASAWASAGASSTRASPSWAARPPRATNRRPPSASPPPGSPGRSRPPALQPPSRARPPTRGVPPAGTGAKNGTDTPTAPGTPPPPIPPATQPAGGPAKGMALIQTQRHAHGRADRPLGRHGRRRPGRRTPAGRAQVRLLAESAGDGLVAGMAKAADRRDGAPVLGRMLQDQVTPAPERRRPPGVGPAPARRAPKRGQAGRPRPRGRVRPRHAQDAHPGRRTPRT